MEIDNVLYVQTFLSSLDRTGHPAVAAAPAAGVGARPLAPVSCSVPSPAGTAGPARWAVLLLGYSFVFLTDINWCFFCIIKGDNILFFPPSGLLSTPNLISLPQQNQGSLLSAQNRMGLQAQVRGNFQALVSGKGKKTSASAPAVTKHLCLSLCLTLTFIPVTSRLPQRDKCVEVSGVTTVPSVTSHPEEPSDLEELEQFARTFKQRRIKLGFTQVV